MQDPKQPYKILITHLKTFINICKKRHVFYPQEKAIPKTKEFQILFQLRLKEKLTFFQFKKTIISLRVPHINKDQINNSSKLHQPVQLIIWWQVLVLKSRFLPSWKQHQDRKEISTKTVSSKLKKWFPVLYSNNPL